MDLAVHRHRALAGRVVDRLGVGWSLMLGGVSLVLTALARSVATGPLTLWAAVAIMGLGGPLVSAAAPTLCSQWFGDPTEQRRAVGLYNLGPALGGTIAVFATNSILLPWLGTWRRVLQFEAGLAAAALLAWLLIWQRAPSLTVSSAKRPPLLRSWAALFRSRSVVHTLVIGSLAFFVMHSLGAWLVDALENQASITATASGYWVAAGGFVGMGLITIVAEIAGRFGLVNSLSGMWFVVALGLLLVALAPPLGAELGTLITGVRNISVPLVIMMLMASPDVGPENMGVASGLWFAAAQIGATTGPFLTGRIADGPGGFTAAILMLAAVSAALLMLVRVDVSGTSHPRPRDATAGSTLAP